MNSIGIGDKSLFISLIPLAIIFFHLLLFIILLLLLFHGQNNKKVLLKIETKNASEFSFITEGKFETFKNGDIVFYASESDFILMLDR